MKRMWVCGVVLFVQIAALLVLIARYERVVRYGTEVRVPCQGFDPYDPLRGRYLQVRSSLECTNWVNDVAHRGESWDFGSREVCLRVCETTNGLWEAVEVTRLPPKEGVWFKREAFMNYRMNTNDSYRVSCDLPNQLFVNENLAMGVDSKLQKASRENRARAVYRVLNGDIVLTDIEIDGKSVRER